MSTLRQYLDQPYPNDPSWHSTMRVALVFGLFVVAILLVFSPFGSNGLAFIPRALNAFIFGGVTAFGITTCGLVLRLFRSWSREEVWTLGKELLWGGVNFLVIAFLNFVVMHLMYGDSLRFGPLGVLLATLAVGFFPYALLLLFNHARMLRAMLSSAAEANENLEHTPSHSIGARSLTLSGENDGEELEIAVDQVVCVRSAGNYIDVFSLQGEEVQASLLRCPLTSASDQLKGSGRFIRTHRTCILHLDHVQHVEGNAQGYRVTMNGMKEKLPVSRSNIEAFDRALAER